MLSKYWIALSTIGFLVFSSQSFGDSSFGLAGRAGRAGETGRAGRSGYSLNVVANGQSMNLDLNGENGGDGRDGEAGESALNCTQPEILDNLSGAAGGAGGDGGAAGNGGNGGDLTIHAINLQDLSKVYVSSRPGIGGRSGRPGVGGSGCYCKTSSWSGKVCQNVQNPDGTTSQVCEDKIFQCTNGKYGTDGKATDSYGKNGKEGHLTILRQLEDPTQDQSLVKDSLPRLVEHESLLTKNVWSTHNGALKLLAPGSIVSDDYTLFEGQKQMRLQMEWAAQRPVSTFKDVTIAAELDDAGNQVNFQMPTNVWYRKHEVRSAGLTKVTFDTMFYGNEATQLSLEMSGRGSELIATVTDKAALSDVVSTSFAVDFRIWGLFGGTKLYRGDVSNDVIEANGNSFIIHLGKLPEVDLNKIKPNTKLYLDVVMSRTMDSFQADKELDMTYRLQQ